MTEQFTLQRKTGISDKKLWGNLYKVKKQYIAKRRDSCFEPWGTRIKT